MPSKESKKMNVEKTNKSDKSNTQTEKSSGDKKMGKQNETKSENTESNESNETVEVNFKDLLKSLENKTVEAMKAQLKNFREDIKKLSDLHRAELKTASKKTKKNKKPHVPTGFECKRSYFGKLAEFIGVQDGTCLNGPELTSRVWDAFRKRDKLLSTDNRIILVDKESSELFNVPMSVNKITNSKDENGFNFCTLQKYLKPLIHQYSKEVKESLDELANDDSKSDLDSVSNTGSKLPVKTTKSQQKTKTLVK